MDKPTKKEFDKDADEVEVCFTEQHYRDKGYNQAITDYEEYLQDFLEDITGICVDYDGYRTAEELKKLIDDIKDYTIKRLDKND